MMIRSLGYGVIVLILVGCNTQIAVIGAARERLVHPTPFGARWVKEGMTRESRKADWGGRVGAERTWEMGLDTGWIQRSEKAISMGLTFTSVSYQPACNPKATITEIRKDPASRMSAMPVDAFTHKNQCKINGVK